MAGRAPGSDSLSFSLSLVFKYQGINQSVSALTKVHSAGFQTGGAYIGTEFKRQNTQTHHRSFGRLTRKASCSDADTDILGDENKEP